MPLHDLYDVWLFTSMPLHLVLFSLNFISLLMGTYGNLKLSGLEIWFDVWAVFHHWKWFRVRAKHHVAASHRWGYLPLWQSSNIFVILSRLLALSQSEKEPQRAIIQGGALSIPPCFCYFLLYYWIFLHPSIRTCYVHWCVAESNCTKGALLIN